MDTPLKPVDIILADYSASKKEDSNFQFPKNSVYEEFMDYHQDKLSEFTHENKLSYLFNNINITTKFINTLTLSTDRKACEINIDVLRQLIEKFMKQQMEVIDKDAFNYYPDVNDAYFNQKLSSKTEFQSTKLPLILKEQVKDKNFKLSNAQRFAKNFISENTPYNGILLWHEVGVGKTCAGISIAENFRNKMHANSKKILILTPSETLQQNWSDEIFNIEKELINRQSDEPVNVQCTGNTYASKFSNVNEDNFIQIKRQSKKYISQFYQLLSYNKLAKSVEFNIKQQSWNKINKQKAVIDYIKNEYSNRLIVMDEVHVTRESDESSGNKIAVQYIELIARYAENTKIVLLTATPMYNISSEIVWLMNILLLNDKRAPLRESDIFQKDGIRINVDEDGSENTALNLLIEKTRGYISYVRGSNPINFPIRLDPDDNSDNIYTPSPTREIVGGTTQDIDESTLDVPIKNMKFFKNNMSNWQWKNLRKLILYSDEGTFASTGFSQVPIRASNIIFPSYMDINKEYPTRTSGIEGDNGFDGCFTYDKSDQKYEMVDFAKNINNKNTKSFLDKSNLSQYSRKMNNIVKACQTNKGIGFIFSQYLKSGTTIMALALEQNGFVRYLGNDIEKNLLKPELPKGDKFCARHLKYYKDLTESEKSNFVQARYILLDGSVSKPQLNQLIKECRGEGDDPNLEGEHIKIVIGSRVTEQGLSLHRVREVHIMDPWHHLNQMAQATGRAVRNKSHIKLPENKRNVTIHLHISALPKNVSEKDKGIETPDERIYRKAFNKKLNMAKVERLIKKNAVDCKFNRLGNIYLEEFYEDIDPAINPLSQQIIIDSKGKQRQITLYDKDGSINCDFESCDYHCYNDNNNDQLIEVESNNDTNSLEFSSYDIQYIEEFILNLFRETFALYENDIIDIIVDQFKSSGTPELDNDLIYLALDNIVKNRVPTKDIYGRSGFVINRNNIYIFQPFELEDVHIPMLYRYIPNLIIPEKTTLPKISETSKPSRKIKFKPQKKDKTKSKITESIEKKWNTLKSNLNPYIAIINISPQFRLLISKSPIMQVTDEQKLIKQNLIKIMMIYKLENTWTSYERMLLLKLIIENKIQKISLNKAEDVLDYEEALFNYYNKSSTGFILTADNLPSYDSPNHIKGFRFIIDIPEPKQYIYLYDTSERKLRDMTSSYSEYLFNQLDIPPNESTQYGWLESKKKKGESLASTKLFLFYDKDKKDKQLKGKKHIKKGGICGQVEGARSIKDLINFIVELILDNKELFKGFFEHSDTLEKKSLTLEFTEIKKLAKLDKDDLCLQIQHILRYIDYFSKETNKNNRAFYSYEERLLQNILK